MADDTNLSQPLPRSPRTEAVSTGQDSPHGWAGLGSQRQVSQMQPLLMSSAGMSQLQGRTLVGGAANVGSLGWSSMSNTTGLPSLSPLSSAPSQASGGPSSPQQRQSQHLAIGQAPGASPRPQSTSLGSESHERQEQGMVYDI
ncbi:expressed unknown protein [Ectocarpus siliculosus]|uniref:Uncharacterized protein n=1 Tax=Ectocarpus siliculosus TaxID=2880 RepID=D8LDK0_ECTSI|nr:expressed unknown protein [Ectocarpus siliculosus]|eukprot:CBN74073.1 expressed unknown protein [Ectocarpus siliculosus]